MKLNRVEWVVVLVTGVVRVAAHVSLEGTRHARHVLVDAYTYWAQATALTAGKNPFQDGFYQPPGYPIVLSYVQRAFGEVLLAPRIIQQLCGLLTVVLVMHVARSVSSQPWAGVVAGLLYGLYGPAVMFELDLLTPAIVGLLVSGVLLLVVKATAVWLGVAAFVAALAASLHPSMLLLAVGLFGVAFVQNVSVRGVLLGIGLGLVPMTGANIDRFGQWQVGSNNAGINFYIGNNDGWRETTFTRAGLRFRKMALEAEPHRRDSFERNQYWSARTWSDIAAAPHRWVGALATKALWSINNVEIPRNEDHRCRTRLGRLEWLGWLPVRYGWVWPLAIVGLCVRFKTHKQWAVLWLSLQLPLVVFIVSDRYRLASWALVCVLAPLGIQSLREWVAAKRWAPVALMAPVALIPFVPIDARTGLDPAWCDHTDANLAVADGATDEAERLYSRAVQANGGDWSARRWLAVSLMKEKRYADAMTHVEVVLDGFPDSFPMLKLAASIEERRGRLDAAAYYMERAYEVPGKRTNTGMQLLRLWDRTGNQTAMQRLMSSDRQLAERWLRSRGR